MIDNAVIFKDTAITNKTGVLTQTLSYMRGPAAQFAELFRAGKTIEVKRKELIRDTAKLVLAGFANNGASLTMAQKEAITAVFLRADVQSLLADYSLVEISQFLDNDATLSGKITELENALGVHPDLQDQFIEQARALGYKLATGRNTNSTIMLNAGNIAKGYGTPAAGRLSIEQAQAMEKILDPLVSFYALQYMPTLHKLAARDVLREELTRPNGENGVAVVLKMHQLLQSESREKLFNGSEALLVKGYTPEVYNPFTELKISDQAQDGDLLAQGFIQVEQITADPTDPNQSAQFLYVRKDVGLVARPSGMLSLSAQNARGAKAVDLSRDPGTRQGQQNLDRLARITQARINRVTQNGFSGKRFDPTKVKEHFMSPLLNPEGEVVNYRYTMTEANKDSILERKNHFEHLLGVMAGSTFDKVSAPTHNATVVQALFEHFKVDSPSRPASYIEVGPDSADLEMREVYRLLPEQTKQDIERIWGSQAMMVRNDMVHLAFGYRKYTLSNIFEKDAADRNAVETIFADTVQYLLVSYARLVLNMSSAEAKRYALKASLVVRQSEDVWKELVGIVKDAIVIKTGIVLLGNVWSNTTILMMHGMSLPDIAKHHAVAYKAAQRYQEDSEELYRLQTKLASGISAAVSTKLTQDILALKNALARNPVTELMDAGLRPSIIQDVSFDEDIYAYKTRFERGVEGAANMLNPAIRKAAEQIYMTRDTPHYQMLSKATQLSDFVARYSLYQHLSTRKLDPMSSKDAINAVAETFVMYDIALPPALQYMDDMGIIPFTKFFLSIQRVIINLARQHPIRMLAVAAGNNFFDLMPTVLDSSITSRLGNNPFYSGPFRMLDAFGETLPVKAGMSLFR